MLLVVGLVVRDPTMLAQPYADVKGNPAQASKEIAQVAYQDSLQLHIDSWSALLNDARSDKYCKYGIYASRILGVKHPELYLQGDAIFLKHIMSNNGYQMAYSIKDVHDPYFTGSNMKGPPFSFNDVNFASYSAGSSGSLYAEEYPVLPFVDMRMYPIATTLKPATNKITQLELAEQFYFSLSQKRDAMKGLYLICCDSEDAYVYDNGNLTWMKSLDRVATIEGNPILILNDKNVWYPLMGRDDTAQDPTLDTVVKKYATATQTPKLTASEIELVAILREVTKLDGEAQVLMACLAAVHSEGTDTGGHQYTEFVDAWKKLKIAPRAMGIFEEIIRRANRLSPIAAHLAWTFRGQEGEEGLKKMTNEYLRYAATRGKDYAHGHTWTCNLVGQTIDECYRTQAGHCTWQSASMAAVLDLAGMDSYLIEGVVCEGDLKWAGHHTVYVPKYDLILDNARIGERNTVLSRSGNAKFGAIRYISHEGKWANPWIGAYVGTLSPKQLIQTLSYLKSLHDDDIRGLRLTPGLPPEFISYSELTEKLNQEQGSWRSFELP